MTSSIEKIAAFFPERMRKVLCDAAEGKDTEEIHLRRNAPLQIVYPDCDELLEEYCPTDEEIAYCLENFCQHSVYACEDEMRQGYVTLPSCGIRAGIYGSVLAEGGKVQRFRSVSGFCIRLPREQRGCAKELCRVTDGLKNASIVIAALPAVGKTTLLRDMARVLSDTYRRKVCIVDERSEIAGTVFGDAAFDVGMRTSVLDGCPKAEGMSMALRTLSPDIIITDEIGGRDDTESVKRIIHSGVSTAVSIHADSEEKIMHICGDMMDGIRYTAVLRRNGRKRIILLHDREKGEKTAVQTV